MTLRKPQTYCMLFFAAAALMLPPTAWSQTITISTIEDLQKIGEPAFPLDGDYLLGGDIDASATTGWDNGSGFLPIGTSSDPFTGTFDGAGYTITGLYINRPEQDYIGLFGYVDGSPPAILKNLWLEQAEVYGRSLTGALVGFKDRCLVINCYGTGLVSAAGNYAGGLIGRSESTSFVRNCYSRSTVSGAGNIGVGGLVGWVESTPFEKCYSAGLVSGTGDLVGGLAGYNNGGTFTGCFWDKDTSEQTISAGGMGKTTAEMKGRSTFTNAGWDFMTVWGIMDGQTYPFFRGEDDPPQAVPDLYEAGTNSRLSVAAPGVLDNDSDADGDELSATLVQGPSHGTLSLRSNGSFVYTPAADFSGTDEFTYTANAAGDNSTPAAVTIIVGNTPPAASADNYTVYRNWPLNIFAPGVLDNDTDPNGDSLTAVLVAGPDHGTVELKPNGAFRYIPDRGFYGTDNFTYAADDGSALSASAGVTINVKRYCLLITIYGDDAPETAVLRRYRDEVLAKTAAGRLLIKTYYHAAPRAEKVLGRNQWLYDRIKTLVDALLPYIERRLQ